MARRASWHSVCACDAARKLGGVDALRFTLRTLLRRIEVAFQINRCVVRRRRSLLDVTQLDHHALRARRQLRELPLARLDLNPPLLLDQAEILLVPAM